MVEKYLISKQDVVKFHPMAEIPQVRFDPYIIKAQELDLKPVLNDSLYYDFLSKFDQTADPMYDAYKNLLNGTTYTYSGQTVEFPGVRPMLCSFVMARFVAMNQTNVTRYGVVNKISPQSEPVSQSSITYLVNGFRADGVAYQNQVEQFLLTLQTTYQKYGTFPSSVQSRTGVKFINSAGGGRSGFGGWWNGNYYP